MKHYFLTFLGVFSFWLALSQEGFLFEDHIYEPNIKSVKFHIDGLFTSMPIIDMNSSGRLALTFDDINGGDRYFNYKIIHCTKDWTQSDITDMDYLDGFNDEEIDNVYYSVGTRIDYSNYELYLPNDDVDWRISGNYLLVVYDEETNEPVITRRFMIAENLVSVIPALNTPMDVLLLRSHQVINFIINHKNFPIDLPLQTVYATVMQNGRWDNMITNVQPVFHSRDIINYDRTQSISFDSYKEFRNFDIRSIRVLSNSVHSLDVREGRIDVLLNLDRERTGTNIYFESIFGDSRRDINGDFIIETLDDDDSFTEAEYVHTYFNLQTKNLHLDSDIYLFGKFTDWKIQDQYRLEYDATRELYRTNLLLKQGYYDYMYLEVDKKTGAIKNSFEGSWNETENDYTIVVYHRKFGERYDRIIGVRSFNTVNN